MDNLSQIKYLLKSVTDFKEQEKIILKFVVFQNPKNYTEGVYQLGNFYIGRTKDFKSRVTSHVMELINFPKGCNKAKSYMLAKTLTSGKLTVKILSKNQEDEEQLIEKLYPTLPLTNYEFVTKTMVSKKRKIITEKYKNQQIRIKSFGKLIVAITNISNISIFKIANTAEVAKKMLLSYLGVSEKTKSKTPRKKPKKFKPIKSSVGAFDDYLAFLNKNGKY